MRILLKYKTCCLIVCVFIHLPLIGQLYTDTPWFVSLNRIDGDFQVHSDKLQYFNGVNPSGFEMDVGKWLLSENIQSRYGIYSKWGLQINYTNFNHNDLGYTFNSLVRPEKVLYFELPCFLERLFL